MSWANQIVARRAVAIGKPEFQQEARVSVFEDGVAVIVLGRVGAQYAIQMPEADALAIAEAITGAIADAPEGRRKLETAFTAAHAPEASS